MKFFHADNVNRDGSQLRDTENRQHVKKKIIHFIDKFITKLSHFIVLGLGIG